MKRCLIISAGEIRDYERVKSFLQPGDFFIFCDGGLIHADGLGLKPDLIVGDFDSCDSEDLAPWKDSCETVRLPREKDDTDMMIAETGETALNMFAKKFIVWIWWVVA